MPQAKTLREHEVDLLFEAARRSSRFLARDTCMIALSFFCGLRAQEIAYLEMRDITDASGALHDRLAVTRKAGKSGKPRVVPLPTAAREALANYLAETGIEDGPLFFDQFKHPLTPNAVYNQMRRLGERAGLDISSHSGRRTCLTLAARKAHLVGGSLRDVQLLAGHASLSTTECYIDPSDRQAQLLEEIYRPTEPLRREQNHLHPQLPFSSPSSFARRRGAARRV